MKYEEAIQYFERRKVRTDLPDRCDSAEELAIEALKKIVQIEKLTGMGKK